MTDEWLEEMIEMKGPGGIGRPVAVYYWEFLDPGQPDGELTIFNSQKGFYIRVERGKILRSDGFRMFKYFGPYQSKEMAFRWAAEQYPICPD